MTTLSRVLAVVCLYFVIIAAGETRRRAQGDKLVKSAAAAIKKTRAKIYSIDRQMNEALVALEYEKLRMAEYVQRYNKPYYYGGEE